MIQHEQSRPWIFSQPLSSCCTNVAYWINCCAAWFRSSKCLSKVDFLTSEINRSIAQTRGALLSFVLVALSFVPFWIWLNSAPRPALLGGLGGTFSDTDGRFGWGGGGASLGRGGSGGFDGFGGEEANGWNWTAGTAVLSTDIRLAFDLKTEQTRYRFSISTSYTVLARLYYVKVPQWSEINYSLSEQWKLQLQPNGSLIVGRIGFIYTHLHVWTSVSTAKLIFTA